MTAPSFINTGFAFASVAAATDVQNIIDAVNTMLTSTLSAAATGVYPNGERWSLSGAGPYVFTAPSDNGGRFMKVTLTRTTQFRLEFKFEDPSGVLCDGEIDIANPGPTPVNIFGGPGHLTIESINAGTRETAQAFLTDPTPEPMASSAVYVYGRVFRDTAGVVVTNRANSDFWAGRYRGGTTTGTTLYQMGCRPTSQSYDGVNCHLRTQAGSDVVAPYYIGSDTASFGATWLNGNKAYMHIAVDVNNAPGSILTVPIDIGITGTFYVLGLSDGSVAMAVRKT